MQKNGEEPGYEAMVRLGEGAPGHPGCFFFFFCMGRSLGTSIDNTTLRKVILSMVQGYGQMRRGSSWPHLGT